MIEHLRIPTEVGAFDALAAGPEDGRPVLLLHGFPQSARQWEYQLGALAAGGCRAVAPDQRGYSPGVRPESVDEYRLDELVADVLRIADALGWPRFDLAGHDWGAAVAWAVAAEHPARVHTLTALAVPHPDALARALREDEDQAVRSAYLRLFANSRAADTLLADDAEPLRRIFDRKMSRDRIEEYVERMTEPGALAAALKWYRAINLSTMDIGPVTVPTLFVWGTEDVAIGSTAALACGEHVGGPYRFEMVADASHWLTDEVAGTVTALMLRHLLDHLDDPDMAEAVDGGR
jgi:pimeloyl-ACP methyl ester carboxylesterase